MPKIVAGHNPVMLMQVLVNSFGGTVCAVAAALQANDKSFLQDIPPAMLLGGFLVSSIIKHHTTVKNFTGS